MSMKRSSEIKITLTGMIAACYCLEGAKGKNEKIRDSIQLYRKEDYSPLIRPHDAVHAG